MTEDLGTWRCPECGGTSYYWRFETPDGTVLAAMLPTVPDTSSGTIEAAKQEALAKHEESK